MAMMLVGEAMVRALHETGPSVLYRIIEYAYATGEDLVDYDAARAQFDRRELTEPPALPPLPSLEDIIQKFTAKLT